MSVSWSGFPCFSYFLIAVFPEGFLAFVFLFVLLRYFLSLGCFLNELLHFTGVNNSLSCFLNNHKWLRPASSGKQHLQNHSNLRCCWLAFSTASWSHQTLQCSWKGCLSPSGNHRQYSPQYFAFTWRSHIKVLTWSGLCHLLWPKNITAWGGVIAGTPVTCIFFLLKKKNFDFFFYTSSI